MKSIYDLIEREEESILTDYDTINGKENEFLFSELLKYLNNHLYYLDEFYFDKENLCFVLKEKFSKLVHIIKLSSTQKELMKKGIINDNIKALLDLAEKKRLDNKAKEIIKNVEKTGELPTESEAVQLYKKELEKELANTKAKVITERVNYALSKIMGVAPWVIAIGGTYLLFSPSYNFDIHQIVLSAYVPSVLCLIMSKYMKKDSSLEDSIAKHAIAKNKLSELEGTFSHTNNIVNEAASLDIVAKTYSNTFLTEVNATRALIDKLPEEERYQYANDLLLIHKEFESRISELAKDPNTFSETSIQVHNINYELLPGVMEIQSKVEARLRDLEESEALLAERQMAQSMIAENGSPLVMKNQA